MRIAGQEFGQDRRQLVGREGKRRRHSQQALRRAALTGELAFQRLDLRNDAPRRGIENLAFGREVQGPGRALQKAHPQPGLEPGDELADGRWRQSKAGCGGRETFGIDHPDEGGHLARMIDHCRISELIS